MAEIDGSRADQPVYDAVPKPTARDQAEPDVRKPAGSGDQADVLGHHKDRAAALTQLERSGRIGTSDLEQDTDLPEADRVSSGLPGRAKPSEPGGANATDGRRAGSVHTDQDHGAGVIKQADPQSEPASDVQASTPMAEPSRSDETAGPKSPTKQTSDTRPTAQPTIAQDDAGVTSPDATRPRPTDHRVGQGKPPEPDRHHPDRPLSKAVGAAPSDGSQPNAATERSRLAGPDSPPPDDDESAEPPRPTSIERVTVPTARADAKSDGAATGTRDIPSAERYRGELIRVRVDDPAAASLAERLGGDPSVAFDSDPDGREFDTISDDYIAQTKPASLTPGSRFRNQARETFEASLATGRTPYFHFESEPHRDVIRKLHEYERRYKIRAVIDTDPFGD